MTASARGLIRAYIAAALIVAGCAIAGASYDAGARAGAVFGRATAEIIERIER